MRRRAWLVGAASAGGCSILPARPYVEKREWPLDIRRPVAVPPAVGGKTLLVRTLRVAPGLEARGLQVVQGDGSVRTDYYEEWTVPPADAVEDVLRRWLAASGLFSAVLAPGSRLRPDFALEGELLALVADPNTATSRAALSFVVLDLRAAASPRVLLQAEETASAAITVAGPPGIAAAGQAAVARLIAVVERRISLSALR